MPPPREVTTANARVAGIIRGRDIDANATLELEERVLLIAWSGTLTWRLDLEEVDGIAHSASQFTAYLTGGDVLDVSGDATTGALGAAFVARAYAIPELTRGLRGLGSLRGAPGSAHDAWYAPLLSLRRTINVEADPLRHIAIVDAVRLETAMRAVMAELAAVRAPTDAPAQRAIEAILEEHADTMFAAIHRMGLAAESLRAAPVDTQLAEWRVWMASLRAVFVATDESWGKLTSVAAATI